MGWTEKVTVTLPKEDVRRLREVEADRHVPFSAVIREAVETWLKIQEEKELRERYRRYYSDRKVRTQESTLARHMARGSASHWPSD
jgi:Arc/MetJ-type ribon-helix-helix transcriptional regulator